MIKNFTLLLFLFATFSLNAQNINIPDANFKKALVDNTAINTDGDGEISESEAVAFTGGINVYYKKISDLSGIEKIINITSLDCSQNQLKSLDLTKNTNITSLNCSYNQLTNLDLTNNTAITHLYCNNNQLTNLDLTKNTNITYLNCYSNQLTNLDLTKNTAITHLYCNDNQLINLDLTKNINITYLNCSYNQLTNLDLTNNTAIKQLSCYHNQLNNLNLTNNTAITNLNCYSNQLTNLDLTKNTAIIDLDCGYNQLSSINLTKNTAVTDLFCNDNQLTNLDLTNNKAITHLYCLNNQFPFSELQKIKEVYPRLDYYTDKRLFFPIEGIVNYQVDYSSEVTIDGKETTFTWFNQNGKEVNNEYIEERNKGIFKFLKEGRYYCNMTNRSFHGTTFTTNYITIYNNIPIDIPDANFKKELVDNSLINIDGNDEITEYEAGIYKSELDVSSKDVSDLTGIEHFINIPMLNCSGNQLSSLDIRKNKSLIDLNCSANQIKNINIGSNYELINLNCSYNELSDLLPSNYNTQFVKLNINQNHLPLSQLNKIKAINPKLIEIEKLHSGFVSRQFDIFDVLDEELDYEIDYSAEALFDEKETTFTWTTDYGMTEVDENSVKTINPGVFKFLKTGIYHCEMTNEEFPDIIVATNAITINIATGINDILKSSIVVYPNPVITDLNIKFEKNEDRMIYIYDVKGQIRLQQESYSRSEQLNISNFKNGIYILKIQSESGKVSYKILKK